MERPHRMLDERTEQVEALLGRARRTLGHLLDRAESELTHTHARVVALSPRPPSGAATRSCRRRTATWSATRPR